MHFDGGLGSIGWRQIAFQQAISDFLVSVDASMDDAEDVAVARWEYARHQIPITFIIALDGLTVNRQADGFHSVLRLLVSYYMSYELMIRLCTRVLMRKRCCIISEVLPVRGSGKWHDASSFPGTGLCKER